MKQWRLILCSILLALIGSLSIAFAASIPPPPSEGFVRDDTATLSQTDIADLNQKIKTYQDTSSNQIGVLIVPKIPEGDYLENYSLQVARSWGIGQKDKNNGVLLLVAKDDRLVRIEVGSGNEGDLTDLRSSRIIRERIVPKFKTGDYYGGINTGIDGIVLALKSQPDNANPQSIKSLVGNWAEIFVILAYLFLTVLSWIAAMLARSKSWWAGGILGLIVGGIVGLLFISTAIIWFYVSLFGLGLVGLLLDFLVSKNYRQAKASGHNPSWWAGGSFGRGGISSSGFGGGGFSGGGSSGSW